MEQERKRSVLSSATKEAKARRQRTTTRAQVEGLRKAKRRRKRDRSNERPSTMISSPPQSVKSLEDPLREPSSTRC